MFTSLYVKTNYSLLSSLVSIDNLILYAVEHKLSALAICDDNMTSTKIFYDKCIKKVIVWFHVLSVIGIGSDRACVVAVNVRTGSA